MALPLIGNWLLNHGIWPCRHGMGLFFLLPSGMKLVPVHVSLSVQVKLLGMGSCMDFTNMDSALPGMNSIPPCMKSGLSDMACSHVTCFCTMELNSMCGEVGIPDMGSGLSGT